MHRAAHQFGSNTCRLFTKSTRSKCVSTYNCLVPELRLAVLTCCDRCGVTRVGFRRVSGEHSYCMILSFHRASCTGNLVCQHTTSRKQTALCTPVGGRGAGLRHVCATSKGASDVVVIGGGAAGLTAAYFAAQEGATKVLHSQLKLVPYLLQ